MSGRLTTTSGVRDRLPLLQTVCDQFRAFPIVATVEGLHVPWFGAPVDTGCPHVQLSARVRMSRPISRSAIDGLQPDIPRAVQQRRVRVEWPFSVPIVEDARRLLLLLHRFAPVSR